MALIAKAEVKSDWLEIAVADTSKDALIDRLIAQVEDEIFGICGQPVEQTATTVEFLGEYGNTYPLYYTVPVTLTTLKYRDTPADSWTLVTGDSAAYIRNGVYSLYYEDGFHSQNYFQAVMNVGYTTVPDDVKLCAYEMVTELFLNTPYAGQGNRFGVSAINESEGGVSWAKTIASMRARAVERLKPYTRVLI